MSKLDTVVFLVEGRVGSVIQSLPLALPKVVDSLLWGGKNGGGKGVWKLYGKKNLTFRGRRFKESITVEIRRRKEVKRLEAIARHEIHPASRYILSTNSSQALF